MNEGERFTFEGQAWRWRSADPAAGSWHFLTIDGPVAAEIRYAALGRTNRFGSVKVEARIGGTSWRTSLFPHKESGGFVLPLKAEVRRREGVADGSLVHVEIAV